MKLTTERKWWLEQFSAGGWTMGRPMLVGIKKWDAHSSALVKMGLLEANDIGSDMYHITDAGRQALAARQAQGGEE